MTEGRGRVAEGRGERGKEREKMGFGAIHKAVVFIRTRGDGTGMSVAGGIPSKGRVQRGRTAAQVKCCVAFLATGLQSRHSRCYLFIFGCGGLREGRAREKEWELDPMICLKHRPHLN